jgi:hypothetical protein
MPPNLQTCAVNAGMAPSTSLMVGAAMCCSTRCSTQCMEGQRQARRRQLLGVAATKTRQCWAWRSARQMPPFLRSWGRSVWCCASLRGPSTAAAKRWAGCSQQGRWAPWVKDWQDRLPGL